MLTGKSALALVAALVLQAGLPAQAAPPKQEPEALAFLEKADKATYSPRRAGLKDLQYRQTLSHLPGIVLDVKWMAPDRSKVAITAAENAPQQTRLMIDQSKDRLETFARQAIDMVVGKENKDTYAGDEVTLAGPSQVKIVARSERSKKLFTENLITFDARGLPIVMKSVTASGTLDMQVAYEQVGGLWRMLETRAHNEKGDSRLSFEYQESGAFTFIKKIRIEGGANPTGYDFSEFKDNKGLKEEDFK